jgi:hypothetical protein
MAHSTGPATGNRWDTGNWETGNRWEKGDIAFLHAMEEWSPEDQTAMWDYVPYKATQRKYPPLNPRRERALTFADPVIVLDVAPGCALITTVSAYSSNAANRFLPPWRQLYHRDKNPEDFRSFVGSALVSDQRPPLRLRPGDRFPKPRTSWVWIQSAWVVPLHLLGRFTKVPGHSRGVKLRMLPESLEELCGHMAAVCLAWPDCQSRLAAARGAGEATLVASLLPAASSSSAAPSSSAASVSARAPASSPSPSPPASSPSPSPPTSSPSPSPPPAAAAAAPGLSWSAIAASGKRSPAPDLPSAEEKRPRKYRY